MTFYWVGYIMLFFSLFALAIFVQRRRDRKKG
jgi:hypothetical protein